MLTQHPCALPAPSITTTGPILTPIQGLTRWAQSLGGQVASATAIVNGPTTQTVVFDIVTVQEKKTASFAGLPGLWDACVAAGNVNDIMVVTDAVKGSSERRIVDANVSGNIALLPWTPPIPAPTKVSGWVTFGLTPLRDLCSNAAAGEIRRLKQELERLGTELQSLRETVAHHQGGEGVLREQLDRALDAERKSVERSAKLALQVSEYQERLNSPAKAGAGTTSSGTGVEATSPGEQKVDNK